MQATTITMVFQPNTASSFLLHYKTKKQQTLLWSFILSHSPLHLTRKNHKHKFNKKNPDTFSQHPIPPWSATVGKYCWQQPTCPTTNKLLVPLLSFKGLLWPSNSNQAYRKTPIPYSALDKHPWFRWLLPFHSISNLNWIPTYLQARHTNHTHRDHFYHSNW